jgi:hypothetical protein
MKDNKFMAEELEQAIKIKIIIKVILKKAGLLMEY